MTFTDTFIESIRPEIRDLPLYNAGLSAEFVRGKFGLSRVAKLASNENPHGASVHVRATLENAMSEVACYPDPKCGAVRTALAKALMSEPSQFVFGNGSEELLSIAARAFLTPGDEVVTVVPSFGLHVICPESVGAVVKLVPMRSLNFDVEALCSAITEKTRMRSVSMSLRHLGVYIQ